MCKLPKSTNATPFKLKISNVTPFKLKISNVTTLKLKISNVTPFKLKISNVTPFKLKISNVTPFKLLSMFNKSNSFQVIFPNVITYLDRTFKEEQNDMNFKIKLERSLICFRN